MDILYPVTTLLGSDRKEISIMPKVVSNENGDIEGYSGDFSIYHCLLPSNDGQHKEPIYLGKLIEGADGNHSFEGSGLTEGETAELISFSDGFIN